jgi:hypothetical protein
LDGLAPPPVYRWVEPPPALASSNQAPSPGDFRVGYRPGTGSVAGVFSTKDFQVTVALGNGSLPTHGGTTSIELTVTPQVPADSVVVPDGLSIAGNVVQVQAVYLPSGSRVARLEAPGEIVLAYPHLSVGVPKNRILTSPDGIIWSALKGRDSFVQQLARASISRLGYFAVGQLPQAGATPPPAEASGSIDAVTIAVGVTALVFIVLTVAARRRSHGASRPGS